MSEPAPMEAIRASIKRQNRVCQPVVSGGSFVGRTQMANPKGSVVPPRASGLLGAPLGRAGIRQAGGKPGCWRRVASRPDRQKETKNDEPRGCGH